MDKVWMRKSTKIIGVLLAFAFGIVCYGISPYLYHEYASWQFEHDIKKEPLFGLIAKKYPEDFAAYLNKIKQDLTQEDNTNLIQNHSTQLVNKIFYKSLQHAPDDYIVLYLKATLDLYHYLNAQDPRAVVKLENGDNTIDFDFNSLYERKDFQTRLAHLLDTKRFVIGAAQSSSVDSDDKAKSLIQGVLTDLNNKFGDVKVKEAFTGKSVPNFASQVIIDFYANILGAGKENAGLMMRHIAKSKIRLETSA